MTLQLTTTHRRIVGAVIGAWIGIQVTILSGWPILMLGLPLLGALAFGAFDRSGRLLPRGVAMGAGIITAEAVFTVVTLVSPVTDAYIMPLRLLMVSVVSVAVGRWIRLAPAAVPVPVPAR